MPELSGRGRKGKKGKAKAPDFGFDVSLGAKRKRGAAMKAMSVTPSVQDDDDEDRNSVRPPFNRRRLILANPAVLKKRRKTDLTPAIKDKMKKAFLAIHKAVMDCEDDTGRKRSLLFKDVPDKNVRVFPGWVHSLALRYCDDGFRIIPIITSSSKSRSRSQISENASRRATTRT